ncbi:restriction endonuclease subunit S [Zoogloea sp.]|uniref:restriction endonuclease subunit S n=1 Tax=Zoogloea sp. TaxID=49181 RepID=UPI002605A244|nr:restriction endonuclease subunit S [Zoogloea sp.]MDD3354206.1 restriction endonuclease subunit S [Zoogloea sp.]
MSLPRCPEYKDSGVEWLGDVPAHWSIKPLWTLFRRSKRVGFEEEQLLSVYRDHGVIPKASRDDNNNKASDDLSVYQLVQPGDLAINKMKAWQGSVAISDHRGIVSPAYFVFEATHGEDSKYLHYLLRSPRYITGYLSLSKGIRVNQWDLEPQQHSRMPVLVPPTQEQTAIATFLDRETAKIDALIAEQEKLLTLLAEKRQATISHAVTKGLNPDAPMKDSGVEWLGEVPAHWSTPPLYLRYSCELGKMLDTAKITGKFLMPYLRNTDVQWGAINYEELPSMDIEPCEYERYTVRNGDLLVCEGGEVGRTAIAITPPEPIGFQKALHRLRALQNDEHPSFMYFTLNWAARHGVFNGEGMATIANLTGEQLRKYRFPKPPVVEQVAIAKFLEAETGRLDALTTEATRAITLLKERRTALISAAVTGKIDVREAA